MPVWISSTISNRPRSSGEASAVRAEIGRVAGPDAGFTLDRLQHHADGLVVDQPLHRSGIVQLRLGKPKTLGSNSGSKAFLPDADMVASVRPWKAPLERNDFMRAIAVQGARICGASFIRAPR